MGISAPAEPLPDVAALYRAPRGKSKTINQFNKLFLACLLNFYNHCLLLAHLPLCCTIYSFTCSFYLTTIMSDVSFGNLRCTSIFPFLRFLADILPNTAYSFPKACLGWGQISGRSDPPDFCWPNALGWLLILSNATHTYEAVSHTKRSVTFIKPLKRAELYEFL